MSAVRDRLAALATGRLFLRALNEPRPLPTLHAGGGAATDAWVPGRVGLGDRVKMLRLMGSTT